uniref:hypothetical protein n=1 Tax=Thaumasiovibrio occultus TaxID=1891184 RepID=UPI000B34C251|nr:hypothetical protein [Thaumasiovibrio occultus]
MHLTDKTNYALDVDWVANINATIDGIQTELDIVVMGDEDFEPEQLMALKLFEEKQHPILKSIVESVKSASIKNIGIGDGLGFHELVPKGVIKLNEVIFPFNREADKLVFAFYFDCK